MFISLTILHPFLSLYPSLVLFFSSLTFLWMWHGPSLCPSLLLLPLSFLVPLFVFLCRTPNTSSNGNPGYESLPLSDRQSPPPSVSFPVCVPSSWLMAFPLVFIYTRVLTGSRLCIFPSPTKGLYKLASSGLNFNSCPVLFFYTLVNGL